MLMQSTIRHNKLLAEHDKHLRGLSKQLLKELRLDTYGTLMKLRTFAGVIEDEIRIFGDTVKMAQLGKLNPDQFSYETIREVAHFIWDMETEKQLSGYLKVEMTECRKWKKICRRTKRRNGHRKQDAKKIRLILPVGTIRTIFTIVDIPNIETITSKTMAPKKLKTPKIWYLIGSSRVVYVRLG